MSKLRNRLTQLEKRTPTTDTARIALLRPSEILARVDELISQGATPTDDQARRMDALRWMVTHEQP